MVCGRTFTIVNYQPATQKLPELGYVGRHQRPGTRAGTKCRGSFGGWIERRASGSDQHSLTSYPDEQILTDDEIAEVEADLFKAIRDDQAWRGTAAGPDRSITSPNDMKSFEAYCREHSITPEDEPVAFAAYLHEISASRWDGDYQRLRDEEPGDGSHDE